MKDEGLDQTGDEKTATFGFGWSVRSLVLNMVMLKIGET